MGMNGQLTERRETEFIGKTNVNSVLTSIVSSVDGVCSLLWYFVPNNEIWN